MISVISPDTEVVAESEAPPRQPWELDPIVVAVLDRQKERSNRGWETYGKTMERDDTSTVEWLRHAQEEAMDLAIYLERVIRDLEKAKE
jgi:hypothetical protein